MMTQIYKTLSQIENEAARKRPWKPKYFHGVKSLRGYGYTSLRKKLPSEALEEDFRSNEILLVAAQCNLPVYTGSSE